MGRGPLYPVAKSPLRWVTPGAARSRAPSGRDVASGLRIDSVWMSGREVGVSVVLISQASSEHSVCFAVPEGSAGTARETIVRAFERGFDAMLATKGEFGPGGAKEGQLLSVFVPSLTAMVGFWATLSLNIPDFTRYAKNQRDQVLGQALGLPTTMTLFAFISVAVTSATTVIFADPATGAPAAPIWDPTVLAGKIGGGFTVVLSLFALAIATLSTNIAANVVSPANALINAAPQRVGFRLGGYITAGLGLVVFPWKLIESTDGYIFTWLVGYSALLGPIGGILVADYFILRKTRLDVDGLYRHQGPYTFSNGWNRAALVALLLAVLPNVPGFLHQAGAIGDGVLPALLDDLYTYAWFVGFLLAGALYLGLMRVMYPTSGPATAEAQASAPEGSS